MAIVLAAAATGAAFALWQTTEGAEAGTTVTNDSSAVDPAPLEVLNWVYLGAGAVAVGLFFWRRWYRWGAGDRQLNVVSPIGGLAMGLVMIGIGVIGTLVVMRLFGIETGGQEPGSTSLADSGRIKLGSYAAQGIVVAAFVWLVIRARRSAKVHRCGVVRAVWTGALALLLFWPIVNCTAVLANVITEWFTNQTPALIAHTTLQQLVDNPVDRWSVLMVALVLLAAPVYEEILYRGILQQAIVGAGIARWPAILAISFFFALVHLGTVPLYALPSLFVLSIGFGWVYEKTGRLSASITMHAAFNLTNLLLAWWLPVVSG